MAAAGVIDAFTLPAHLEAAEPPEARGLQARRRAPARLARRHRHDRALALQRAAAMARRRRPARRQHEWNAERRARGDERRTATRFELHLSTRLPGNFWVVEVRRPGPVASLPYRDARAGDEFELEGGGRVTLLAPYPLARRAGRAVATVDRGAGACRTRAAVSRTFRQPDSIQLRHGIVAGVDVPDGLRHRAWQRRDAVGRPSVHRRTRHAARLAAAFRSRRCCFTPASRAWKITSRRTRSTIACRRRRPSASTRRRRAAVAWWRSGRRSCVRSRTVTDSRGITSPARGWTESRDHAGAAAARGERDDHRFPRTARHASRDGRTGDRRGRRRRTVRRTSNAPIARRSRRDTCGTSSATRT